jgi:integrase
MMPSKRLSELFISKIKAPKSGRVEYFDSAEPGLVLRTTGTDHKSWSVVYRFNGRLKRYTIGPYKTGKARIEFNLDAARAKAREAKALIRDGKDPVADKRATRLANGDEAGTFKAVADDWLALHVKRKCAASTAKETERILARDVFDLDASGKPRRFQARKIDSITFAEIDRLIGGIVKRGADAQANQAQKRLGALFNWAVSKRYIKESPIRDMPLPTAEKERERYLDDTEIALFWQACERIGWPFGPLFQLLLLTAARRDEVGQMEWSEVDLDAGVWTLPSARAKNRREHVVHLSEQALAILRSVPNIGRKYVFSRNAETFVTAFAWGKISLDQAMAEAAKGKTIPPFILHDLRRTAATHMAAIGIAPHVVDKILNHRSGTIRGVAAIYIKAQFLPEREQALQAWGNKVESLVAPGASRKNVHPLKARA